MLITSAIQKGKMVYVYNGNRQLFVKEGTLQGYTATTVSIIRNACIYTFNEKGSQLTCKPYK